MGIALTGVVLLTLAASFAGSASADERDAERGADRTAEPNPTATPTASPGDDAADDAAEQRVKEVLRKLRAAYDATQLAQAEASRLKEELTLYKFRLDDAQRMILQAQETVDELEQARREAEADAARARSTARRFREQQLIARAREEGRQEGFQEGFSRGTTRYEEAVPIENPRERRYVPPTVEEVPEEEEREEPRTERYGFGTAGPAEILVRTPASEYRSLAQAPSVTSSGRPLPSQPRRPPSR